MEQPNLRKLWMPKRPETKKPCASCPFGTDNDAALAGTVNRLRKLERLPPLADRGSARAARRLVTNVCNVIVDAAGHDLTEETVAIASAIYWSWWRARDMQGETIRE